MAFIPFAATVGAWLGGSAALGGTVIAGTAAALGSSVYSSNQQSKAAKSAASQVPQLPASPLSTTPTTPTAAEGEIKQEPGQTVAASQAAAKVKQKKQAIARSKSVFTSPLGIGTQAETSRKTLLGQ